MPLCLPQTFIHTSGQEPWPLTVGDMQASPKMCHHETNAEEENPHSKCIHALLLGYVETTPRKSSATAAAERIGMTGISICSERMQNNDNTTIPLYHTCVGPRYGMVQVPCCGHFTSCLFKCCCFNFHPTYPATIQDRILYDRDTVCLHRWRCDFSLLFSQRNLHITIQQRYT